MTPAKHRVYCSGHKHEVTLDTRGRLHRTCDADPCKYAFQAAKAFLCGETVWSVGHGWGKDWRLARDAMEGKRFARRSLAELPPKTNIRQRFEARAIADVRTAIDSTHYREGASQWVRCDTNFVIHAEAGLTPAVLGKPAKIWHKKHTWSARYVELTVYVNPVLWRRLCKHIPLGVVTEESKINRLAVAVLDKTPAVRGSRAGDLVVLAGRQARGLSIESMPALVRQDQQKHWHIVRWLRWDTLSDAGADVLGRGMMNASATDSLSVALQATRGRAAWAIHRRLKTVAVCASYRVNVLARSGAETKLRQLPTRDELFGTHIRAAQAIADYAASVLGEVAGCKGECLYCAMSSESCTARKAMLDAETVMNQRTDIERLLRKLDQTTALEHQQLEKLGFTTEEIHG